MQPNSGDFKIPSQLNYISYHYNYQAAGRDAALELASGPQRLVKLKPEACAAEGSPQTLAFSDFLWM